jgi:anti-sigma factor RsiW
MDCKRIRDLILTDYIDDELSAGLQEEINEHLKACSECKQLVQDLRQAAVKPFKGLAQMCPPESVWEGIREKITKKPAEKRGFLEGMQEAFNLIFHMPKPVLAAVTTSAIIFIGMFIMRGHFTGKNEIRNYFAEQMIFLSNLETNSVGNGNGDTTTNIEEYFL